MAAIPYYLLGLILLFSFDYRRMVRARHKAGNSGYICAEYVWAAWKGGNEVNSLSEAVQMRDRLRSVDVN